MILTSSYQILGAHTRVAAKHRAWLIDPTGKIYPCGGDHHECVFLYPEIAALVDQSPEELVSEKGWAKAGAFFDQKLIYFDVDNLSNLYLEAFQRLAAESKVKDNFNVDLSTDSGSMPFPYKDFKNFESVAELNKFYRSSRYGSSRPPDRAWMLSPEGKLYPCGQNHEECLERHEIFRGRPLYQFMREGWTKIGAFGHGVIYLNADTLTGMSLQVLQTLAYKIKLRDRDQVEIIVSGNTDVYDYGVFRKFENLDDIKKYRKYVS